MSKYNELFQDIKDQAEADILMERQKSELDCVMAEQELQREEERKRQQEADLPYVPRHSFDHPDEG